MKHTLFSLSAIVVLFCNIAVSRANQQSLPPKLALQLNNATVDEALQQIARAGNLNLIADASRFPEEGIGKTLTAQDAAIPTGWLYGVANEFGLTFQQLGTDQLAFLTGTGKSYILWGEPDIEPILQAARQMHTPPTVRKEKGLNFSQPKDATNKQWNRILIEMQEDQVARDVATWLKAQGVKSSELRGIREFSAAQLTQELRETLRQLARAKLTNRHLGLNFVKPGDVRKLDDEVWKTARFTYNFDRREQRAYFSLMVDIDGAPTHINTNFRPLSLEEAAQEEKRGRAKEAEMLKNASPRAIVDVEMKVPQAWHDNTKLQTNVTLEAKRLPLSELLEKMSAQSGVTFKGGALANKRLTLGVREMPLISLMVALQDLYQADWQPSENGYTLREREMMPWRRALAQLGNLPDWGYYRTNWNRWFAPSYLSKEFKFDWQELMDKLDMEQLQSLRGVPFSSLPTEDQQEIRRVTRWSIVRQVVEAAAWRDGVEGDWTLRILPNNYPIPYATRVWNAPIPTKPGPPIGEIVRGDIPLAEFAFKPRNATPTMPQPVAYGQSAMPQAAQTR